MTTMQEPALSSGFIFEPVLCETVVLVSAFLVASSAGVHVQ